MTETEIYHALQEAFRTVLVDECITLTSAINAEESDGWASLKHNFIVVELEKRFDVECQAAEMEEFKNVGQSAGLLHQKAARRS